jgi:hypothetical protein
MAAIRLGAGAELQLDDVTMAALADLVADRLEERGIAEPEPWLDVDAAAAYLACPRSRIYDLVSLRKGNPDTGVEHRKDGSRLLFRRDWLDAALERS